MAAHREPGAIGDLPLLLRPVGYAAVAVLLVTQAFFVVGVGYWLVTGIGDKLSF